MEDSVAYGYAGVEFDSDSDFDPEEIKSHIVADRTPTSGADDPRR